MKLSDRHIKRIRKLNKQGYTDASIAKVMKIGQEQVRYWLAGYRKND